MCSRESVENSSNLVSISQQFNGVQRLGVVREKDYQRGEKTSQIILWSQNGPDTKIRHH